MSETMKKLARKLVILGILLAGLAGLDGDLVTKAHAVTCADCQTRYETCMAYCAYYQSACPIRCQSQYNTCVSTYCDN